MFLNWLGVFGLICIGWSFRGKLAPRQPNANKPAYRCHSALPNLFASNPPGLDDYAVSKVVERLDKHLAAFTTANGDINSLIVAVGTSNGPLWYKGYGSARANESLSGPPPDLDTIYRIASITKMFVTLDTLILRDRGVLDW
jgi:CubicO group peptidase (beta-lactamase class C family)